MTAETTAASLSAAFTDLPQVFRHHVFLCFQERPPMHPRGSCGAAGAKPLWEHAMARIEALGDPEIGATATGCMGFCAAGPLMVVYPAGVWYRPQSVADVDEIIATHLVGGRLAERLAIVPRV